MTEKRFECDKGSRIIIDNETKLHYIMTLDWECSLVTKLLNRFAEENEQLKSKNRGLQSELQIFKEDVTHSNLQINKLADENEQLKENCKNYNWYKHYKTLLNENEELKQQIQQDIDDIRLCQSFIMDKGYSLQDLKEWEDMKKECYGND